MRRLAVKISSTFLVRFYQKESLVAPRNCSILYITTKTAYKLIILTILCQNYVTIFGDQCSIVFVCACAYVIFLYKLILLVLKIICENIFVNAIIKSERHKSCIHNSNYYVCGIHEESVCVTNN